MKAKTKVAKVLELVRTQHISDLVEVVVVGFQWLTHNGRVIAVN